MDGSEMCNECRFWHWHSTAYSDIGECRLNAARTRRRKLPQLDWIDALPAAPGGGVSLFLPDELHVDAFLYDRANKRAQPALYRFLQFHRWPAAWQWKAVSRFKRIEPTLWATENATGKRVRVTMASRFGDVGINWTEPERPAGYDARVSLDMLRDFSASRRLAP